MQLTISNGFDKIVKCNQRQSCGKPMEIQLNFIAPQCAKDSDKRQNTSHKFGHKLCDNESPDQEAMK